MQFRAGEATEARNQSAHEIIVFISISLGLLRFCGFLLPARHAVPMMNDGALVRYQIETTYYFMTHGLAWRSHHITIHTV